MKRYMSAVSRISLAALVTVAVAMPASAGQRNQGAVTSGGSSDSGGDSGGRSSGGGSGGGRVSGGGGGGTAVSRPSGGGSGGSTSGAPAGGARSRSGAGSSGGSVVARPREDREAVGRAVPRPASPRPGGGTTVITTGGSYYGGYYPWGYGGLGLGGYYGWYDPWWYDPYYYGRYSTGYEGRLRIKVKPSEAEVFVDGYYAGIVDEFDNIFQSLPLETGPHRIEVREDGYEPLTFEVRILPDRTVTYKGEMKRNP